MAGLEITPGAVVASLEAMNTNLNKIINDAQNMMYKIDELEYTKDVLVGESYDSIRNYYSDMHTSVMRATILFAEAMIQENNTYKGCVSGYLSGIGYVNEGALIKEKFELMEQIQWAYRLAYASKCGGYSSWISSMEHALRLVEKKLDQIDAFKAATAGLYQGMSAYGDGVRAGIEGMGGVKLNGTNLAYSVDTIDNDWKSGIDKLWNTREIQLKDSYIRTMAIQYGFDREISQLLFRLYSKVEMEYGEMAKQKFPAMIASFCYSIDDDEMKGVFWNIVADIDGENATMQKLEEYGFTSEEINTLKFEIEKQHDSCKNNASMKLENNFHYNGKVDFAHLMVILATINKSNESFEKGLGDASGFYNGIFDIEKNAGYVGDVYGTAENGPKLTADDYQADLDAVNISKRSSLGTNLLNNLVQYYGDIENGMVSREKEFLVNIGNGNADIGMRILIDEANGNIRYMERIAVTEEEIIERKKVIANFIKNIIDSNNIYDEYQVVDYTKIPRS